MISRKLTAFVSAVALAASAPAVAQSSAAALAPEMETVGSNGESRLTGEGGIGWVMGGLVLVSVAVVLLLIYTDDDDDDEGPNPVSP